MIKQYCGLVYVITNESMPDLVKIGYTSNLKSRLKKLSNTSTPTPFRVHALYRVTKKLMDKELHKLIDMLDPKIRISDNREFFKMSVDEACTLLKCIADISDTTDAFILCDSSFDPNSFELNPPVKVASDNDALDRAMRLNQRAQGIFKRCGIEPGSKITYKDDKNIVCIVHDDNTVSYNGEIMTLAKVCAVLGCDLGGKASHCVRMFKYKGIMLRYILERPNEYPKDMLAALPDV